MSRIGKKPVVIPAGVTADVKDNTLKVKGSKGELSLVMHPKVTLEMKDNELLINVKHTDNKQERALWGLYRSLVANMVKGVTEGFTKVLEINGVGYKAAIAGRKLTLNLGYSHPIEMEIPTGLEAKMEKNVLTITGIDKQVVGQFAAVIREQRPPEPYKGKGINIQMK
jgi:large subunit ribosomal protein L6